MPYLDQAKGSDFDRLRADYDDAFARLRAEEGRLRAIAQQSSADNQSVEAARQRFDHAMESYREHREKLAAFLASIAATSRNEVEALAHHFWEQEGRPTGRPEEHWYQAEKVLRSRLAAFAAALGEGSRTAH
jgi:hypothetical protein